MPDLALTFGGDLQLAPDGDLKLASSTMLTEQRVLRRLLTNAGDYVWQPKYGAGLAQFVGQPGAAATISGIVRAQLMQESRVAAIPAPQAVAVADRSGTVSMTLQYADAVTKRSNAIVLAI